MCILWREDWGFRLSKSSLGMQISRLLIGIPFAGASDASLPFRPRLCPSGEVPASCPWASVDFGVVAVL